MDIENMKNFIEICKNDYNVTKTSEKVNISQPALSKMINQMEDEFNTDIFLKNRGKFIGLTETGKIIFSRFQEIVSSYNLLKLQVSEVEQGYSKDIKIGVSPKVLDILMKDNIYKLYENDDLSIEFVEGDIEYLINEFVNKKIDIIVILSLNELDSSEYYSIRIATSEYVAIMNKNHILGNNNKIKWHDLENMKIATPTKSSQTYRMIMEKINNKKITLKNIFTLSSDKMLIELPINEDIITILPENFYYEYNLDDDIIMKKFEKTEYWHVDMYVSKEDKELNSNTYKVFEKLGYLLNMNTHGEL